MKWLTIEMIKTHSRIDFECEDDLLMLYADSAEQTLLNICGRSYEEIVEKWGEFPVPLIQASLMLVDNSYTQRSQASAQNLYSVPYTFDVLVKPYMKL